MTAKRTVRKATSGSNKRTTSPRRNRSTKPPSFKTVADLPHELREAVENAIVHRPEGCTQIDTIHKHFRLAEHHVTRATFRRHARLVTWRARLGRIGEIVHHFVGHVPVEQEDRWFRTAHLMLVASLIEALDRSRHRLSISDLTRLTKTYGDYRTASHRTPKTAEIEGFGRCTSASLPNEFADTVRSIYGVTLDDAAKPPTDGGN